MTVQISRNPIRLALDCTSFNALIDDLTGQAPKVARGAGVDLQFGLFKAEVIADDLSLIQSIRLQVKDNDNPGAMAYISKTIAAAALTSCNQAAWDGATGQHGVFTLSGSDTALPAGAYWIVFSALLAGSSDPERLGSGLLTIVEAGMMVGDATGVLTLADADARYLQHAAADARFAASADGKDLLLWDPDMAKYRPLIVANGVLALGAGI